MKPLPESSEAERLLALRLLAQQGRDMECRVEGDSMAPTLPRSTTVRIRFAPAGAIEPGQIVAFVAGGRVISHRVIRRGRRPRAQDFLLTGGDGTLLPDPPLGSACVLGRVSAVRVGDEWREPPVAPRLPFWREALRFAFSSSLGMAMDWSVPLARGLALALIRVRRAVGEAAATPVLP